MAHFQATKGSYSYSTRRTRNSAFLTRKSELRMEKHILAYEAKAGEEARKINGRKQGQMSRLNMMGQRP